MNSDAQILGFLKISLIGILLNGCLYVASYAQSEQSIIVLVNDDPISAYDVNQRLKLRLANNPAVRRMLKARVKTKSTQELWRKMIAKKPPTSQAEADVLKDRLVRTLRASINRELRPKLRKKVIDDLIDERLKLQEAKKLNIIVTDEQIERHLEKIAQTNKNRATGKPLTKNQFKALLRKSGIGIREYKKQMKASLAWIQVVRQKYQRQVYVGNDQIDRMLAKQSGKIAKGSGKTTKKTVYQLQKIRLAFSGNPDEKTKTTLLLMADSIRRKFSSCKTTRELVKSIPKSSVLFVGKKSESEFANPLRAYLSRTKVGQMTPATIVKNGVEFFAVCSRNEVAGKNANRKAVKATLRQQEFGILAKRHLRDLRQDAFIEYKS